MKDKTPRKPNLRKATLTVDIVKEIVGKTWFHIQQEDGHILLSTRDNGSVYDEQPGIADIKEGRRLLGLIQKRCPFETRHSDFETIDEWAHVTVNTEPRPAKELAEMKAKKMAQTLHEKVKEYVKGLNAELLSGKDNCRAPVSTFMYDSHYDGLQIHVTVTWGKRLLYQSHLNAMFALTSAEQALAVAGKIREVFPDLNWSVTEGKLCENITYNYRPPNNIIETYADVKLKHTIRR